MNTLQQIIEEMEDDFSRHNENGKKLLSVGIENTDEEGWMDCLEKYIPKLKLLLKEEIAKDLPQDDNEDNNSLEYCGGDNST